MKITVLDGFTLNPGDLSWEPLASLGQLEVYDRTDHAELTARGKDSEILLTNKTRLPEEALRGMPKLRYIGVLATGFDVVDVKVAARLGITVTNIPAYGTDSVAQHVFALLLELSNHVGLHDATVKRGEWSASRDWCYQRKPLIELSGKTMGVVGYGRIGAKTAEIARAFGMKVKVHSRTRNAMDGSSDPVWCGFEELLKSSDVVSLHCPLTPETENMINGKALALMKKSALLINTSRGKLIVEEDLADALANYRIAGAALDVLREEPPVSGSLLMQAPNCLITPHLAWASREARNRLLRIAVDNLRSFLNGKPANQVNA